MKKLQIAVGIIRNPQGYLISWSISSLTAI